MNDIPNLKQPSTCQCPLKKLLYGGVIRDFEFAIFLFFKSSFPINSPSSIPPRSAIKSGTILMAPNERTLTRFLLFRFLRKVIQKNSLISEKIKLIGSPKIADLNVLDYQFAPILRASLNNELSNR